MKGKYPVAKRLFDLIFSLFVLCFAAPVFLIIALLVRLLIGSPVLFKQKRIGLNEREFVIYKFRTMTNATDKEGKLLSDEQRLIPFGRFLRSTSLDELPQLFSVLFGQLSLVGPRPLLPHYLPRYSSEQRLRHTVMPGITGWAQINGRNDTTWEDRFEKDIWYVRNWSFLLDLKILLVTVVRVLKRSGVSSKNCVTMPEFMGNKK